MNTNIWRDFQICISVPLNNSKCMKIWRGLANNTHRPSDNLDNFIELSD